MGSINTLHTNFTAGELSPRMLGRIDVARYNNGAEQMDNFLIYPQGGICRRTGSYFGDEVKDSTKNTYLVEFEFSDDQAYMLEFGDLYIRFFKNNGRIESPPGTPVEIVSPYIYSDLSEVTYFESADQVFLFHGKYPTQVLTRLSDTSWTIAPQVFQDGPYQDQNISATTLQPSGTSGSVTITASAALFVSTDVGRMLRIQHAAVWGWGTITAFTNSTHVTLTTGSNFGATTAVKTWRLGAWSATTGYPQLGTFHEERFTGANTTSQPQSVWLSSLPAFNNFAPSTPADSSVVASNAITATLASAKVNGIRWLDSSTSLLIGTQGAEWALAPASTASPLAPANYGVHEQSAYGGKKTRVRKIGFSTLFVQKTGRDVKEMSYNVMVNGFDTKSTSLISEHLLRENGASVDQCAYQQQPFSTLWYRRTDGALIGFTYIKEQDIYGWHYHQLGGNYMGGPPVVESIAVISAPDAVEDQLWMVVKRTINGTTKRYIEFLTKTFLPNNPDDKANMVFSDCSLTYSGAPTTHITGLDHLIGETVIVLSDGNFISTQVVANDGTIDFPANVPAGSTVTVGLPYTSQVKTLREEGGGDHGTAQGRIKRITKYVVRLLDTLSFETSADGVKWTTPSFRATSMNIQNSPSLFTGDIKNLSFDGYTLNGQVYFRTSAPYPLSILAVMLELEVND